jgi:lipoprotein-anchoring transpeptidase ErfK/SrfK
MSARSWRIAATAVVATFALLGTSAVLAVDRPWSERHARATTGEHRLPRVAVLTATRRPPARLSHGVHGHCTGRSLSPTRSNSWAAVVKQPAVVYSGPGGERILGRYARLTRSRYPTFFAILSARSERCRPVWLHVQLSDPPNGRTGWVRPWLVTIFPVRTRILVDLSQRRLTLYRSGRRVLSARVGVGAAATPTPTGRFFVNERWRIVDPGDPLGVAALGISAHSTVLPEWTADGPIALHGTNEPATVGEAVSHGCLRLSNPDIRRLLALTPAGTPVTIRP